MRHTTIRAIAHEVNTRTRSAGQIARETLERAAAYDSIQPEAWISRLSIEELLERARHIDQRVAAGESLPLAGVPFAVKDNIDVAGLETTAACPSFAYRPSSSAHVIERLLAAGAMVIGKTNMDQFATGLVGTRSPLQPGMRLQSGICERRLQLRVRGVGRSGSCTSLPGHGYGRLRPYSRGIQQSGGL